MAHSNLMLMCVNLVCISAAGVLVLWALMHIQKREKPRLRIYDEPPLRDGKSFKSGWRKQSDQVDTP